MAKQNKVAEAVASTFELDSKLSARWTNAIDSTVKSVASDSSVYHSLVLDTFDACGEDTKEAIKAVSGYFDARRGVKGDAQYAVLNAWKSRCCDALRALSKGASRRAKYAKTLGGLQKWYKENHGGSGTADPAKAYKASIAKAVEKFVESTGASYEDAFTMGVGYLAEVKLAKNS